jgi:hypothetical protein
MSQPTWANFLNALFWALVGLSLGIFVKVNPREPNDRFTLIYNLSRYAKYVGLIAGTGMLIEALRIMIQLVGV